MSTLHGCRESATASSQEVPTSARNNAAQPEDYYLAQYRVDDAGCWIFQGTVVSTGYGMAGRFGFAHRLFYERLVGPIPQGLVIDHLCRVRSCVNPAHLEPVTYAENTRRAVGHRSALLAVKTHCPKGHEYTDENTRVVASPKGKARKCRICERATWREWYARTGRPGRKAASNG